MPPKKALLLVFEGFVIASQIGPVEGICGPGREEAEVEFLPGGPANSLQESLQHSSDVDRAVVRPCLSVTGSMPPILQILKPKLHARSSEPDPQQQYP